MMITNSRFSKLCPEQTQSSGGRLFVLLNMRKLDYVGKRFDKLVVVKELEKRKNKSRVFLCKCDCGNEVEKTASNLRLSIYRGNKMSCGCNYSKRITDRDKHKGLTKKEKLLEEVVYLCKTGAIDRGYSWNLTSEEYARLAFQNCYYCGAEPKEDSKGLKRNGIDRYDNDVDYYLNNCVPCCFECNKLKKKMHGDDFIDLCKRITNNLEKQIRV